MFIKAVLVNFSETNIKSSIKFNINKVMTEVKSLSVSDFNKDVNTVISGGYNKPYTQPPKGEIKVV